MLTADKNDKDLVVEILTKSFRDNKSVNYIVNQDSQKEQRLKTLMAYSFDVCHAFGDVFLSDDKNGCALLLLPDQKRTTIQSILWDIRLIRDCIGVSSTKKALVREAKLKQLRQKGLIYYLWFIGVEPGEQHKGTGSQLLLDVIEQGEKLNRPLCLETSTEKNLPWYSRHNFRVYNELDLGYRIYFLQRE